jgi:Ca2+:H+ antiporter
VAGPGGLSRVFLLSLGLVPLALVLAAIGAPSLLVFAMAGLAVLPLARLMGVATEELAKHAGPGIGGFLNATFGNAVELIIGIAALLRAASFASAGDAQGSESMILLVKASITGSIIGNILLVLGLSLLVGGLRHKVQKFSAPAAMVQVTMMALAVAGLVLPEVFALTYQSAAGASVDVVTNVSLGIAVLLIVASGLGLLFSLHTHKDIFNPVHDDPEPPRWSRNGALGVLLGTTVMVALVAEVLIGAVEGVTESLHLTELFVGVMIIAIVGNAAEHGTAVIMAWRNKMDLSVGIATISSAQIALFVTPVLVLVSVAAGATMDLAFEAIELVAIILSVVIVSMIARDGESNWFEGALLLILYAIIGVGFFFHP